MSSVPNPLSTLTLDQLRSRTSAKWRAFDDDVLPAWVAEMDVDLADPVRVGLIDALNRGDTGYSYGDGYAEALAGFARDRWAWEIDVARTLPVADVITGLMELLLLVTEPGDGVVLNPPVYPPFYALIDRIGRRVVEAPLGENGRLDLDRLEAAFGSTIAGRTPAAYLLCNPHNPTGAVPTPTELATVAALARQHRVRIVADEIHAPLVLAGATFTPLLQVPGAEDAFSVWSASKGWNLAGLKAAVIVAGPASTTDLARIPGEVRWGASHLGTIAHTLAFRAGGGWLDALLAGLAHNRQLLGELISEQLPDVTWIPPEGTFLAWLDCRRLGWPDPAAELQRRGRLAVSPGVDFGTGGAGHIRLNFATSPALVVEAVSRIAVTVGRPPR